MKITDYYVRKFILEPSTMVQEAAYFAWENAGSPSDRDLDFWLQGEREIIGFTAGEIMEGLEAQEFKFDKQ
jgi:Protein of unknown function (DUF2934)